MRDKLISIIEKAINDSLEYSQIVTAKGIADYLLANGVIVPPVKVGQTVYVLSKCKCMKGKWAIECLARGKDSRMKYIDRVNVYNPQDIGQSGLLQDVCETIQGGVFERNRQDSILNQRRGTESTCRKESKQ